MARYDYIILGAGAAGLMMARAMAEDSWFSSGKILIIDQDFKDQNDRTWCYWEEGTGKFDHLLSRSWEHIYFRGEKLDNKLSISPYRYKMLRSADYYREQIDKIKKANHIEFLHARVEEIKEEDQVVQVKTSSKTVEGSLVLNSLFEYKSILDQHQYPVLQQHFIGWFVETDSPVFDQTAPVFMDFTVPQKGNTRFMYVLPFSKHKALVEYTLFSKNPLDDLEYEQAIEDYLKKNYSISEFRILEKEKGNIPMTCYDFEAKNTERIIHIGTAGGWAKPSTGYTFKNSMRNSQELIPYLKTSKSLKEFTVKTRYWYYDLLLLDILTANNELGSGIFESLFKKRKPQLILKFLDEEGTAIQDLQAITGCPMLPFTKALWARLLGGRLGAD
ncbi:MAG: lycopene cyclase family protein [Flavobacteriaceae bacterium]